MTRLEQKNPLSLHALAVMNMMFNFTLATKETRESLRSEIGTEKAPRLKQTWPHLPPVCLGILKPRESAGNILKLGERVVKLPQYAHQTHDGTLYEDVLHGLYPHVLQELRQTLTRRKRTLLDYREYHQLISSIQEQYLSVLYSASGPCYLKINASSPSCTFALYSTNGKQIFPEKDPTFSNMPSIAALHLSSLVSNNYGTQNVIVRLTL